MCFILLSLFGLFTIAISAHNWRGKNVCKRIGTTTSFSLSRSLRDALLCTSANCKIGYSLIHAYVALWYNWIICFVRWFMEKWFKFWSTLAFIHFFLRFHCNGKYSFFAYMRKDFFSLFCIFLRTHKLKVASDTFSQA